MAVRRDADQERGTPRWTITVGDRADMVFPLRDYFARLGIAAEVRGPTEVELVTDCLSAELTTMLADWVRVVDVPARFVVRSAPPSVPAQPAQPLPRLGSLLMEKGFISGSQLELALNEARETRELLGILLVRKQWIFEEELARTLSQQLSLPYVSIGRIGVDERVARRMPRDLGNQIAAIPVRETAKGVQVAFADPTDPSAREHVAAYFPKIEAAVAELTDIRLAWRSVRPVPTPSAAGSTAS
jgi:Type II secretion system (T2SS), protein E, N-terminal domain